MKTVTRFTANKHPGQILLFMATLAIPMLVIVSGCGEYKRLTNDPPKINSFTVPNEVQYGDTVEFRVRVFDPEDDTLTYEWEVSDGTLILETGPEVQWTAPPLPIDPVVPPIGISVKVYVRDGISEENVSKSASVLVFSKAYRVAQTLSGAYELTRYEVRGDRLEVTGTLRLTTTTFSQQQSEQEVVGEVLETISDDFLSGAYELIEPFDARKGTIQWAPDGGSNPSLSTYTWDGKHFSLFWPSTGVSAVYQKQN